MDQLDITLPFAADGPNDPVEAGADDALAGSPLDLMPYTPPRRPIVAAWVSSVAIGATALALLAVGVRGLARSWRH